MKKERAGKIVKPWLSQYNPKVPRNIEYEQTLLSQFLDQSAKQFPENTALILRGID